MGRFSETIVLVIVTSLAACVSTLHIDRCSGANETYCDATRFCQPKNETCFDCCSHVHKFCDSVDIFGKICNGLSDVCSVLGHEYKRNIMSSAMPSVSTIMTVPLSNTIAISMTQSGVVISASAGSVGSVSGPIGSASMGSVSGSIGSASIGSVSGSVGSVSAGSIGSVSGSVGSVSAGSIGSVSGSVGSVSAGSIGSVSGSVGSASAGSIGSVSGAVGSVSAGSVGSVSGAVGSASAGSVGSASAGSVGSASAGSVSGSVGSASAGSVSGSVGSASAGSVGSVSGSVGSASAGSLGSVSGSVGSASAGLVGSVSGSVGSASAAFVGSVSGSAGQAASASVISMTWPSIVTSAFGSMIATVSPSAHSSHAIMSSFTGPHHPWWSSYNISDTMERFLGYIRNNSDCKHGEKFCGLKLQCIPEDQHCAVHLTNDMMRNLSNTAWCVNCSSDQYFCPLFMQCIDVNQSCSYENVHHWINSGNASNQLRDIACGINETFCFKSMMCKSKGPLHRSEEHKCGHDEVFCPYSASCRNKTDCAPFPALNYSMVLENDTFGWAHMCQIKNLICPNVARAMVKCEHDKYRCNSSCPRGEKLCNDHYCIPVNETCCPVGKYFCNKSEECLPDKDICCSKGEEYCSYTKACSAHADCLPPIANVTFPTVCKFLPLDSNLSKAMFKEGNVAVALQSIEMHGVNGSLEFYGDSKWTAVQDLSPSNALVLGPSNYLRFVSSKRGSHGIVLVNFTAYRDKAKIGQYVDASSLTWKYGQTIAIFELPLLVAPKVVYNGSIYTVAEDSKGDVDFDIWDHLYNSAPEVDSDVNIPDSVLADVNRGMVELYNQLLDEIDTVKLGLRIKDTSEKIKFKGGSNQDYYADKTELQFIPKLNFHGNVSFSMESFVAAKNKSFMAIAHFFAPEVAQALNIFLKGDELKLVKKVLFQTMKDNLKPSDSNLGEAAKNLDPKLSSNEEQTVLNNVKKILSKTYAPDFKEDPFPHIGQIQKRIDTSGGEVKYIGDITRIRILVTPVNDKPKIKRNRANLRPVPYNLNVESYTGGLVSEVFDQSKADALVEDVDDRNMHLGAVVLAAGNNSLGQWQYKMNNTMAFTDFNFTKDVEVMLLPPEARIKLDLHNQDTIWSSSDAFKMGAFIKVKVWDMTDNRDPGVYDKSIQDSGMSISDKFANLLLLRRGCDNKTDFAAKNDRCGVCRGKDECVACDDVPNSNATRNKCGHCVGGNTGFDLTYKIDCAGQCDKNINDSVLTCGKCMNKKNIFNATDCTGTCFGGADYNDCGKCAGGKSGIPKDYGKDLCGKCGGDNTTCADCAGVPNGKSTKDYCKQCRKESDANFNTGCSSFGQIKPVSGEYGAATEVTLRGAGFKSLTLVSCQFNNTATSEKFNSKSNSHTSNTNIIKVTAPTNLPAGTYSIVCAFSNSLNIETQDTEFTVYNRSSISMTGISPSEAEVGSPAFNVTISGTGFVDTGYLACLRAGTTSKVGQCYFVSSTEVACTFGTAAKSALFNVSLAFGQNDPSVDSGLEFSFYAEQPEALSIRFEDNPSKMLLTLDRPAKLKTANPDFSCSDFFDQATLAKFTSSGTRCVLRTSKKMLIKLIGPGATIAPGDTVIFKNGSLAAQGERNTKFVSGNTSLTVGSSPNPPVPEITILGQNKIGPCATAKIETITKNDGGRPMDIQWYVNGKAGVDANTTADMEALNATLNATQLPYITIGSEYIVRNVEYEIVVKASNFLGESTEATLAVTRMTEAVPEIKLSSTGESILRSQKVMIRARVSLPGCNGSDASSFSYDWELKDSAGDAADLGADTKKDRSFLKLDGGNLNGGENYTLTVNVFDAEDPSITAAKSVIVEVQSSDLIPRIKGGVSFDVGYADYLVLDGSGSEDPDKTKEESFYQWACKDSNGFDCFDFNNNRVRLEDTAIINKSVATFLKTGQTYNFELTFRKGVRSKEASVKVRVQECSPPKVTIKPQKSAKLNTEDEIVIEGQVHAVALGVNLEYSFVSGDGLAFVSDLSTVAANNKPAKETFSSDRVPLVKSFGFPFKANSLQPGTYKFKVAANTTSCSSYSETKFVINGPPFKGTFTVEPSNGTAVDTKFTFRVDLFTDDQEDLPLKYKFGYYEMKDGVEVESYLGFKNPPKSKSTTLAQGDSAKNNTVRVFVKAYDRLGASVMVEKTVTVNPKVFSLAELQDLQTSGDSLEESGDLENQLGTMNTIMSAVDVSGGSAEVQEAVNQLKESYTNMAVNVLEAVEGDKDAERNALGTAAKTTDGGADAFGDSTKNNFFATFKKLQGTFDSQSRRRRRAVEPEILDVNLLTAADAESTLTPLSNLIAPAVYTEAESTRKKDFLELVDTVGLKVCAGRGSGAPAVFAKTTLVAMRGETRNFDGIASATIDVACSDCSSVVKHTAKMTLGKSLEEKYSEWSCATGETCSGACLLSTQYPNDLLLNESDSSRLTDIVQVKLYNPVTKREVNVGALASSAIFLIPLKTNVTFPNDSYVECKLWSSAEANWTTTGCESTQSAVVSGDISYVQCNCTQLGYLSVFMGPATTEAPSTVAPTTAAPTTSSCLLQAKTQGVNCTFKFNEDYASVISNASQKATVESSVRQQSASALGMDECTIQDFSITKGSIVVSFVVVPKQGQTDASLQAAVTKLKKQVESGDFNLTLPGGKVLFADPSSFVSIPLTPTTVATTAAPTIAATPTDSGGLSDTDIIIIAVVCSVVGLIVIIGVTVYCYKKKRSTGKISPSTSPDPQRNSQGDLEMSERGRFVHRKDHPGANNNLGADPVA